jgi:hypothetical protein
MARTSQNSSSRVDKAKALPWAALLQGVVVVGRRWKGLSASDRQRIKELLAESGGRVNTLSAKQRKELRKLAGKLDLKGIGSELTGLARGRRTRRKRRHG